MELNQAFATLEKQLAAINTELHFNREAGAEDALTFAQALFPLAPQEAETD